MKIVLEVKNDVHAAALIAVAVHNGYIDVPLPHPSIGWAHTRMQRVLVALVEEATTDGGPVSVPSGGRRETRTPTLRAYRFRKVVSKNGRGTRNLNAVVEEG